MQRVNRLGQIKDIMLDFGLTRSMQVILNNPVF